MCTKTKLLRMPSALLNGGTLNAQQDQVDDDDCLSYSSTEHEVSLHESAVPYDNTVNARVTTPSPAPLNLSFNNDLLTSPRHQDQIRDVRRQLDRERSMRVSLENKRKSADKERADLIQKLEDVTRAKSSLEQSKIDLEAKIRSLQYNFNEETEKLKNSEMLYNKTKEQLSRKDEQYTMEVETKQKTELAMRNMQMELRSAMTNIKQLTEEKDDLSRQLSHEKNARVLQEQINDEQVKLHESLNKEDMAVLSAQADALIKIEASDEGRRTAQETLDKLKAELYATKMDLERQKSRFKDDHGLMSSENEELLSKIEELKSDIKLNEDALAHATMQYNIQMSQLKTENTVLTSSVEKEKNTREKVEVELESLRNRLQTTVLELEKAQQARSDHERITQKSIEELTRNLENKQQELNNLINAKENQSHQLGSTEAKTMALENELHIANATLAERNNQLQTMQRELDQRKLNHDNLDESFRKEKEDNVRMETKLESIQDRLSTLQHENLRLQQQLDQSRLSAGTKGDSAAADKQAAILRMSQTHEKDVIKLQEQLNTSTETLKETDVKLREVEMRKSSLEQELRHVQNDLTEAHKKCSLAEANLMVVTRAKEQLESERNHANTQLEKIQNKFDDSREKNIELQAKVNELTDRLQRSDQSSHLQNQQLLNQSGNVENLARNKAELEEACHRLELEKAKLEAALDHEQQKALLLQRDLTESQTIRDTLENMVSNLKSTNDHLHDKIQEAVSAKTLAAHDAEDSRGLWESEVKARSKLGLRIAQLERLRQESDAKAEEEKKKTRKALELKKVSDTKLQAEFDKNMHLNKEIATLKTYLKSTKRRLKLDDVNGQLQGEIESKERMEHESRQLQVELNSLRTLQKNCAKLEKAKRKVEEEFSAYKTQVNSSYMNSGNLERLKADIERKAQLELYEKLEEVNQHLEEQAKARDNIDKIRDDNEHTIRKEFEKTKKEMMEELNKVKSTYMETRDEKENLDFQAKKFKDLYLSEQELRERLAKKLERATDKATKAQLYIDRHRMGQSLPLQNAWMVNGASAPPSTSTPASTYIKPPSGHGFNDLSYSIKSELDRSIARHLEKGPQIDISLPPRSLTDEPSFRPSFEHSSSEYLNVLKKNYML